jgi:streptogramin lyase
MPVCVPGSPLADGTRCAVGGFVCVAGECVTQLVLEPATLNPDGSRTWNGVLANLTDALQSETEGDLIATIDWGDQLSDRATVTGSNGTFAISGTHTYSGGTFGAVQVNVKVSDTITGETVSTNVFFDVGIITFGRYDYPDEPQAICAGPDGNLWFTVPFAQQVDRITTSGVITEFVVSSQPWEISPGPDGNIWFTEQGGAIGQITPSGTVTEFPLSPPSEALAIAAGPDGNLWFTDTGTNQIGRITPAGAVTEFPIPTANSAPVSIAAGPDGNMWFVEQASNQIGRISPSGSDVVEFAIGPGGTDAGSLDMNAPLVAAGPDGNVWFVQQNSTSLGRTTPAGVMDSIDTGTYPTSIAVGPDGNIWFAAGRSFGPVTPSGSVTTFGIPFIDPEPSLGSTSITSMTAGPDGNLWFAQSTGISRVLVP